MPYLTLRESHGIYQKFWGRVASPELFESLNAILDAPSFDSVHYVIKDYLDVELFDVGVKTLLEDMVLAMRSKRINRHIVVAIVTTNPEIIDTGNAALSYRLDTYPREVFSRLDEARTWIAHVSQTQGA